jgi:acyl-CoA thioester hydrolase
MSWLETYRGSVYRWEVDNVDHFTVAFYFARFEDATLHLLHAVGLDPAALAPAGRACVTLDSRVRYQRELRVGDVLHIASGVIEVGAGGLLLGHHVFDSADGTLCTTVEQRVALVRLGTGEPLPLAPEQRAACCARQVEWSRAPEVAGSPEPATDEGFIESARDAIRPVEVGDLGTATLPAYIHRFSSALGQLISAFGMTPAYMTEHRRGFSTFEFKLGVPGVLRAGDLVRVRTGLLHVGNSSMRLLHRMQNARTGEAVASLEQAGVHLDLDARRPTPLPHALRERAKALVVGADG